MESKLPPGSFPFLLPLIAAALGVSGVALALVCTGHAGLGGCLAVAVLLRSWGSTIAATTSPSEETEDKEL